MTAANKPSVCFVAHNAYGALAGVDTSHIGGIETQQSRMARWLANAGYEVSMITWDEGHEDGEVLHGVRMLKLCRKDDGMRFVRFAYPRWTSLVSALRRADADVYYYNCGDVALGQISLWARRNGKKILYSIANDVDCVRALPALPEIRERVLYKHGLKSADAIVAQTEKQQQLLQAEYGLHSRVIPMPCFDFDASRILSWEDIHSADGTFDLLWVGRICEEKRVEWYLDLAERMPQYRFNIAGSANKSSRYASEVLARMESIPNVVFHGRLLPDDLRKLYRKSAILCSTSIYEGFPNVYLEAWSVGIPLVTTFDPDNVVATYNMGKSVKDVDGVESAIANLLSSPSHWGEASKAAVAYIQNRHIDAITMPQFEEVINKVVD